jgi:hypothetical protein
VCSLWTGPVEQDRPLTFIARELRLTLASCTTFSTGVVHLMYRRA